MFMPKPNVDSAVIKLTRHKDTQVKVSNEKLMFKIIRASFNQRRKTLANGLKNSPELNFTRKQVTEALVSMSKSESVRGEAFTLEEFAKLTDILNSK